eukprot:Clim_evm31s231 gene=Clim_evmTU31s231
MLGGKNNGGNSPPVALYSAQEKEPDEKIKVIMAAGSKSRSTFSMEFFPPRTDKGMINLQDRIKRLSMLRPLFIDVTWPSDGSGVPKTKEICKYIREHTDSACLMHICCTNVKEDVVLDALEFAKDHGIRNLLVLRGDPPMEDFTGETQDPNVRFRYASDLVKFVREKYGDLFCVAVAGYPEGHPSCASYEEDLEHLKMKVEAGADLIMCQLCYDVDIFARYAADCRKIGIEVPIIPGIMPIITYRQFTRITSLSQTMVPEETLEQLRQSGADDERVQAIGVDIIGKIITALQAHGFNILHFYTMNMEKPLVSILKNAGLIPDSVSVESMPWRRVLPQPTPGAQGEGSRTFVEENRLDEVVRPIFWQNRPQSYILRTESWDQFPNGRWGDNRSPAFGFLSEHHLINSLDRSKCPWLKYKLESEDDLFEVFVAFLKGDLGSLPWLEESLTTEAGYIIEQLLNLNRHGYLTINSQPAVNGAGSRHPDFGWGPPRGTVYQKSYVEFFCSRQRLDAIISKIGNSQVVKYDARNRAGERLTNYEEHHETTAVTWGVFPGREILQPTVVDAESFNVWKDEAFHIWQTHWWDLLGHKSIGKEVLRDVIENYFLVNVVNNDFVEGNVFDLWKDL